MSSPAKKIAEQSERLKRFEPLEIDPHPSISGILLSDQIVYYARTHHLIEPFDTDDKLKPAGYELSVGDEYFLSGEFHDLDDRITIPPFEVAVIKTKEIIRLPRFMIARWNIRVKHAYAGLLWVGGPQVDPGYVGNLFCPIYNLSDKPVTLARDEPLALMDFVKTTPFDPEKSQEEPKVLKKYPFPPKRVVLQQYPIDDLRSALFTRAGRKLEEFEDSIKALETRFVTFTQISFSIFALVIALVAISSRAGADATLISASFLGPFTLGISIAAILMTLFSYLQWRTVRLVSERYGTLMAARARAAQSLLRRYWWTGLAVSIAIPVLAGVAVHLLSKPYFGELNQRQVAQDRLEQSIAKTSDQLNRNLANVEALKADTLSKIEDLRNEIRSMQPLRIEVAPSQPPARR